MADTDQVNQVARQRAEARIDKALGELKDAGAAIGKKHHIPEDIAGHSVSELLGRMAYVPSMARDLRRIAGQELAKQELEAAFGVPAVDEPPSPPATGAVDISKIGASVPLQRSLTELDGINSNLAKALRVAGMVTIADVIAVPDEHLLKVDGVADKSLAQLREAIAKASGK